MKEEKETPTAEEFHELKRHEFVQGISNLNLYGVMIEFAKLHVKKALQEASKVHEDLILSCYPESNIK